MFWNQYYDMYDEQDTQKTLDNNQMTGLGTRSLFVVGDDAQSIYSFRGSKIEIILNFQKEYKKTKEIILNQNYRSNQQILDLAEKILTHNNNQKKKDLFTIRDDKTPALYYTARNEKDEAEFMIRKIHELYIKDNSTDNEEDVGQTAVLDEQKERVKTEFSIENIKDL
jgi:DNA helicase II / ATP-dependent DNA helicase PcrA